MTSNPHGAPAVVNGSENRIVRALKNVVAGASLGDWLRRRRINSEVNLLRDSGFFDGAFYCASYPDVATSREDPLRHFVCHGWREGRQPSPNFDPLAYLAMYPDVAEAGVNPLVHYLRFGQREGRSCGCGEQPLPANASVSPAVALPQSPSGVSWNDCDNCHSDSPLWHVDVRGLREFHEVLANPVWPIRQALEEGLAAAGIRSGSGSFEVFGYSVAAQRAVAFTVGTAWSDRTGTPNWREHLICPVSQLNNRVRAMLLHLQSAISRAAKPQRVYLMEQVTPFFSWCRANLQPCELVGSEWLGPALTSGVLRDGIRHEDVHRLSFGDAAFDVVVSQDVLEHVPDPWRGFHELARITRPGGSLLLSVPFHSDREESKPRASLASGKLVHLAEPQYHGNPLDSKNGSLVFTDFGWDVLPRLLQAGFRDAWVRVYWSYELGHLGQAQSLIVATR